MHMAQGLIAFFALILASFNAVCAGPVSMILVGDVENVEDLVAIPDSRWIIGSGVGNWALQSGGLHLIDAETATAYQLAPDFGPRRRARAPYDLCDGPPDASLFSAHGLSLVARGDRRYQLYVVNHGGRSAIEVFDVLPDAAKPQLQWIGCIPCPDNTFPNGVAALADGGVVMSSTYKARGFWSRLFDNRGAVYVWHPGATWWELPNSELPQNNGIELSDDEQWAYVVSMPDSSVTVMPLQPDGGEVTRIPLDFYPDNIRRAYNGKLVVAGVEHTSLMRVNLCVLSNYPHCEIDYRADMIDPETLTVTPLYAAAGSHEFGLATVALLTREALWLGSVRSHYVLKVILD